MSDELLLHGVVPDASLGELVQEVLVDHLELPGEHTSGVDVAGVRLDGLIVAQDLSRRGSGHRSQQETVADTVPGGNTCRGSPREHVQGLTREHVQGLPYEHMQVLV